MKRVVLFVSILQLVFVCSLRFACAGEAVWEEIGGGLLNLKTVAVKQGEPNIIFCGSRDGLFKTTDDGKTWTRILALRGESRGINYLYFHPQKHDALFAATQGGLFYSSSCGRSWKNIFQGNGGEKECVSITVREGKIYLGTKGGLFISADNGVTWHRDSSLLGSSIIVAIANIDQKNNVLYVAFAQGVYKTENAGVSWDRVIVVSNPDDSVVEEAAEQTEETPLLNINHIALDPDNPDYVYVAAQTGVYNSRDRGRTWARITGYGLLDTKAKFLLIAATPKIFAVMKSGIYVYQESGWHELSVRLMAEEISSLTIDAKGNLYAACDKGLFKANINSSMRHEDDGGIALYLRDEPAINKVQQAAVQYAEVQVEKIRLWRAQAAKKALLPEVSVGLDRNTADLWHWESGSTTKMGDDCLTRGRDSIDWGINLSWDLGELIWNNDQTSIDTRSRLLVQLRDDILDEVTRTYFERIRVKVELDSLGIEDRQKRFEKELRLQELTAMLDALTGGYFSRESGSIN